jgi:16S rRNA (uracil1498-N3)-methyltransferase
MVILKGGDASHLALSLRAAPGDEVVVSDGLGMDYLCVVVEPKRSEVLLKIAETRLNKTEPKIKVVVYQSIAKGGKLEAAVAKCVELGAYAIIPLTTERTVGGLSDNKLARLNSISESAAKQSMRGLIPCVNKEMSLICAIKDSQRLNAAFAAYEREDQVGLKSHLKSLSRSVSSIGFFIGPEGGFSPHEASLLKDWGIPSVSLGTRILRSETAPLAALAAIFYEFGEMGE